MRRSHCVNQVALHRYIGWPAGQTHESNCASPHSKILEVAVQEGDGECQIPGSILTEVSFYYTLINNLHFISGKLRQIKANLID